MKKYIYCAMLALLTCSCADYLDKTPDEDLTLEQVFSDRNFTESFLTGVYGHMVAEWNFSSHTGYATGSSDEMEITWTYPYCNQINEGAWNPSNVDVDNSWNFYWWGIRKANLFLENIHMTPMDATAKNVWIGEAHYMRALYHFFLLRMYGPIPLSRNSVDTDAAVQIERRPFHECVQFIVDDCNAALGTEMPMRATPSQYGRATKAAVLALKSRVLLYAASPLYNGNNDYVDFKNIDGTQLIPPAYDKERWKSAADAAMACITECKGGGYKLYKEEDPLKSYQNIFIKRWNDEILFGQNCGDEASFLNESYLSPNGMSGWSGYCPTQELVDAYQMANGEQPILGYNEDGSPIINTESGYKEEGFVSTAHPKGYYPNNICNMYVGREPRFYASINYNGAMWKGRRVEFWPGGKDGKTTGPDYTKTGYLMKKTSDENYNLQTGVGKSLYTWIMFRLGEQYLNYAEAINEYKGDESSPAPSEAYTYVNDIRNRCGMPDLPPNLTKAEMRERIRHERRIELAFEAHRYYDCRRWKISEQTDNRWIHAMNINAGTNIRDKAFYIRTPWEKRIFESKHYLWPIPQTEVEKCRPAMVQSPGWMK